MKIQNVKGGYDYKPEYMKIRNYITDKLRRIFEEYGYNSIETPILTYYDILSDKYDNESDILKEIYKLSDQGDRELGLRYDLTVPFAKFVALNKNTITMPFKRYEIDKVFRDGPVKVGRDREFTQCDVDVVGISGELIEVELLSIYKRAFDELSIDIVIKYNSRKLMTGLILESGVSEELVSVVTTVIDKKEKLTKEEFFNYLLEVGVSNEEANKLINYFSFSLDELNKLFVKSNNIYIMEGLEEINNLASYIKSLNMESICYFTSTLARGQNYYTGNVFEVYDKKNRVSGSIGAGGRYDNMITNFINDGEFYPAVGISFGLSSIYEVLKSDSKQTSNIDIFIIPMNTDIESLKLANELRYLNYKVELEFRSKKLKKSLDYANKNKIRYVIIIGEDEVKNNTFKLKDMFENKEYLLEFNNIKKICDIINLMR